MQLTDPHRQWMRLLQEYVREVRYTGREKTLPVGNVEVVQRAERVVEERAPEPCAPAIMAA